MSPTSAPSAQTPQPAGGGESHLGACRASVGTLRRLLDQLFPDNQNPDILTVEDVIRRYPLTQLGAPAAAALEQSRRIARARRDFSQMGLAEFHAGLIYLYWSDSRAAAQQFAAARTQWSLSGDIPPTCLSHFAQGLALQHGYHFEAAMNQFGWTERSLNRNMTGAQAQKMGELGSELWPLLEAAQESIRRNLWPQEAAASRAALHETESSGEVAAPASVGSAAADSAPTDPIAPEAEPEPARTATGPVPMPISNMPLTPPRRPTSPSEPLPGHVLSDERYRWFVVHSRRDALLSEITEGTWVLVDTQVAPLAAGVDEELVVLGSPEERMGSVIVLPRTDGPERRHLYLGYRCNPVNGADGDASESTFRLDDSGQQHAIPDIIPIGIVIGFWHNVMS